MFDNNIFAGMNGFVWWVGVVESRKDPLNIGRCQIRIFGWHTENKNLIPTADLPWAQPVLPVNNSKTFNTPTEGDWVVGFFFDGPSGQVPVFFGVLPGIPTPYINNPNNGFSDPRSEAELTSAPNLPKMTEVLTDGGGATVTNQPARRYPISSGYPNTNLLAINDLKNPPESIARRYLDATVGIPGPDAKALSTELAGAAQGAAAAIQKIVPDLKSLIPDASNLASALKVPSGSISSLLGEASDLASKLTGDNPAIQSAIEKAKLKLAQTNVDKQIADATAQAMEAQKKATESLNTTLDTLKNNSGDIAKQLSDKLSGLSPGNISTKTPVVVETGGSSSLSAMAVSFEVSLYKNTPDDKLTYAGSDSVIWKRTNRERLRRGLPSLTDIGYPAPVEPPGATSAKPKVDLGSVTPGNSVNAYAPNTIPSEVPLEKVGSTLDKSIENTVSLTTQYIDAKYSELMISLNQTSTTNELSRWLDKKGEALQSFLPKFTALRDQLTIAGKDIGILRQVTAKTNKFTDPGFEMNTLFNQKYEDFKARGV